MKIIRLIKRTIIVFIVLCFMANTNPGLAYENNSDFAISSLVNLGIISGDSNGDLNLFSDITRAELAQLLLNYYQFKYNTTPQFGLFKNQYKYEDVHEDDWFYESVILIRLLDVNYFCDVEEGRKIPLTTGFYFRPYETVNVYDFRNSLLAQTNEWLLYPNLGYSSIETITKLHYPNCDSRPLTRYDAFLLFFDFLNEPSISYGIHETDGDQYTGPSTTIKRLDSIDKNGEAKNYRTPMIEAGYSLVFGRVVKLYDNFADIEIIYSNNFEDIAYGDGYNNKKVINKVSLQNTNIEENNSYSLLINCKNEQFNCISYTPQKWDFVYNNTIFNR